MYTVEYKEYLFFGGVFSAKNLSYADLKGVSL